MPYTRVRYVGYEVPTVTLDNGGSAIYRIPPGNVSRTSKYSDKINRLSTDAKTRVLRFMKVLDHAREQVGVLGDNPNTLKVFMAPEFYFRPDKAEKAYSLAEFNKIKAALTDSISNAKNNVFKNWLVVCGTALYRSSIKKTKSTIASSSVDKYQTLYAYYNTAIVIKPKGGASQIEKFEASLIDGIPTGQHGGSEAVDPEKKDVTELIKRYKSLSYQKRHFFTVGGIPSTVEICLEHMINDFHNINDPATGQPFPGDAANPLSYGVVKNVLHKQNPPTKPVLHLLPAGGMGINEFSVAAYSSNNSLVPLRGGYIMRSDGYLADADDNSNPLNRIGVQCQRVRTYDRYEWSAVANNYQIAGAYATPNDFLSFPDQLNDVGYASTINLNTLRPLGDYVIPEPNGADHNKWINHTQRLRITNELRF